MKNDQTICQFLGIKLEGDSPFTITYNGKEVYREYSTGSWSKKEYDDRGNETYYENSDGFWWKGEYDDRGNEVYFENSDGFWLKRKYDSEGNQTYLGVSDGSWSRRECDIRGNQTYLGVSDGVIKDHRLKEISMDEIAEKFGIPVDQLKIKKD